MNPISNIKDMELIRALESVKDALHAICGKSMQLIVYGSVARGEEREDSDVDLMVVLPDHAHNLKIEDEIRDMIYEQGFQIDRLFSVMVVTESQMRKYAGFMVFGSVEKEGIAV